MFDDLAITLQTLVTTGVGVAVLVVFEVLVGKRVIRFKGRNHMRVHTLAAYALIVLVVVHGALSLILVYR